MEEIQNLFQTTSQFWITEGLHLTWMSIAPGFRSSDTPKPSRLVYDKTLNQKDNWTDPARSLTEDAAIEF